MQFNSFSYILLFLPLTAAVYFLASRYRAYTGKLALVLAGAVFYALGGWKSAVVLAVSLAVNFAFAKAMEKTSVPGRALLAVPVVLNAALLFVFKYTGFVLTNLNAFGASFALPELMLPLGISFFTFQQVAYLAAVYKKELLRADALDYLAYILYFPKLLMGPLMDPVDFVTQLNNASLKRPNAENIAAGLKLFSFGLFKKLLLADTFAKAVAWGFANTETATAADWLLVMLFYAFEIYFDFSGYTDMATGSSLILNITLPINFDSPYRALSIRDFWKRWHISLTKFFTRYIYIPLGGSRRGLRRTIANTMLVFLISGLWHGANWTFILWGLLHGVFMVFDRLFEKKENSVFPPVRWFLTFALINILWLLFRAGSVSEWLGILRTVFRLESTAVSAELLAVFQLPEFAFLSSIRPFLPLQSLGGIWAALFLVFSFAFSLTARNNYKTMHRLSAASMVFAALAFLWGFVSLSAPSVFLYFNF